MMLWNDLVMIFECGMSGHGKPWKFGRSGVWKCETLYECGNVTNHTKLIAIHGMGMKGLR